MVISKKDIKDIGRWNTFLQFLHLQYGQL